VTHETPRSGLVAGVVWIVQLVPFQRSASIVLVVLAPLTVCCVPTAVHTVVAVHDTS
jgi:hypothetical protein